MCGICGVVCFDAKKTMKEAENQVKQMLPMLFHRGPQGAGFYKDDCAAFGFQRLAIRALTDGNQPVVDVETGVMSVCNGQIDNHVEIRAWLEARGRRVEQSVDVAVIPALYLEVGERFAEQLEGVFAIALWDPRDRKLILVRDRVGERPLFYYHENNYIAFASELNALSMTLPRPLQINQQVIFDYLQRGYFVAPNSPCLAIKKVAPGEMLVCTESGVRQSRYWRWQGETIAKDDASLEAFDKVFRNAVMRQSAVEVNYGLFLSGGLDSSLIAAVLKAVRPDIKPRCYTLRFAEQSYDEGAYAERVAELCDFDMTSVLVDPQMLIAELPRLIHAVGEPLSDPAWIPTALLARRAAQDVRIVFGGEGGDELFCGYPTYLGAMLSDFYAKLPGVFRFINKKIVDLLPLSERKMPLSFLLKRFVEGDGKLPLLRHREWLAQMSQPLRTRLGIQDFLNTEEGRCHLSEKLNLGQLQRYDLETSLAEGLLTKVDRGGMSTGLEVRTPYLDCGVLEFVATLSQHDRIRRFQTKVFLKKYAIRYLPKEIVHRQKRGLSIPLAIWLKGPLKQWMTEKLASGRLEQVGLKRVAVLELLSEYENRKADHTRALWTLLVLDEWLLWLEDKNASQYAELKVRTKILI